MSEVTMHILHHAPSSDTLLCKRTARDSNQEFLYGRSVLSKADILKGAVRMTYGLFDCKWVALSYGE